MECPVTVGQTEKCVYFSNNVLLEYFPPHDGGENTPFAVIKSYENWHHSATHYFAFFFPLLHSMSLSNAISSLDLLI